MAKWTTSDIPDQTGRTAVVTGANTGLGFQTVAALAAHGACAIHRRSFAPVRAALGLPPLPPWPDPNG